ncbi:uncharacterized protein BDZ99DRAFT_494552 [Mytilinidion resinicola]|uniref:Myb-like domain-containing protein n=1 Tax=Mytilinidion resinicola TaxID=574789 RepID=A0A6A6Z1R3_9PEZI|nr:uncharacterized protein BDZ99DRAFT_494552 [Mytilinidion resinicola]KAF2814603.1 hypothetical protein BDZ99DRAFT_494552 [Mytilinidion resinicola]
MPCHNCSDPLASLLNANHVWNNIPAMHHDVYHHPARSSYHGQDLDVFTASNDDVQSTSATLQSEQYHQYPATGLPSVEPTKPLWNQTPICCPIKTEGSTEGSTEDYFDGRTHVVDWDTSNFFDRPFDPTIAARDFLCIPFASNSNRDMQGLSSAASAWNFPSSLSEQSDCGRSFSSIGSIDQPSPNSTYLSDSTYTNTNMCIRGRHDITHSPDPRFSLGAQSLNHTESSPQHELGTPADQSGNNGEMSYHSNFGDLKHWQTTPDGFQIPVTGRTSWPPDDWDLNAWGHPQAASSQAIRLWNGNGISPTVYRSQSNQRNDALPLGPSEQNSHSSCADSAQEELENINLPNSRRKREDYFLVTSKRKGMTYKQIREKGGLQAAESTLRGRFRALTKDRRDRVRKPVWTDKDIQLLHLAVQREIEGLEVGGFARGASLHALESKVSWKKVADCIMANGGSYRFGNATCKKKWKELMH